MYTTNNEEQIFEALNAHWHASAAGLYSEHYGVSQR